MQPPAQELVARDLHDTVWTFRHIYRGKSVLIILTLFFKANIDANIFLMKFRAAKTSLAHNWLELIC